MPVLIVDGYNIVHAWPELKRTLETRGLDDARRQLVHVLSEYSAQTGTQVTVVFDAHGRIDSGEPLPVVDGVTVRYGTKSASADHVIERLASQSARRGGAGEVTVATGDRLQRALVGAMGVGTVSARTLAAEVERVAGEVSASRRQREQGAHSARRVEAHLSAEARRRLESLRSGTRRGGEEEAG
jgi:predicted RNA-binding protein with PIN domain